VRKEEGEGGGNGLAPSVHPDVIAGSWAATARGSMSTSAFIKKQTTCRRLRSVFQNRTKKKRERKKERERVQHHEKRRRLRTISKTSSVCVKDRQSPGSHRHHCYFFWVFYFCPKYYRGRSTRHLRISICCGICVCV
jgi:hypothetical protein